MRRGVARSCRSRQTAALKAPLLVVGFLLATISLGEAAERYRVIEGTMSPDKRYALAWGLRGATDLNKQIESDGELNEEKIENYIVDLSRRKIITKISATAWTYPEMSQGSRQGLEAVWNSSEMVLIDCEGKWGYISLEAYQLDDGELVASANFGDDLEKKIFAYLKKEFPASYRRSKDYLTLTFPEISPVAENAFALTVATGFTKIVDERADLEASLTVQLQLLLKGGALKLDVLAIEKTEAAEDPVVAADRHLNEAYSALRASLDPAGKTALKKEQLRWLQKRDETKDPAELAEFVESRAQAMEERIGSSRKRR